jgi:transposase
MAATRKQYSVSLTNRVLYLAFELGWSEWTLAFTTGAAEAPRLVKVRARDMGKVLAEIRKAKARFRLAAQAPVKSCYEAGRDGFWLHRWLIHQGIENIVVDSASIEVNRRARRAKSDRLDAGKLVQMMARYAGGEKRIWSVVRVPSKEDEDQRQLHRELQQLKGERTEHSNRIKGLLAAQGLEVKVGVKLAGQLDELRTWDGRALGTGLRQRLLRELARWQCLEEQIQQIEKAREQELCRGKHPAVGQVRCLLGLRGIDMASSWLFVVEFFGWRRIRNRRQLASLAGLTPSPYNSGDSERDQGISKAGNRRVRGMAVEIAWSWLRYQKDSALSLWYWQRFGKGSKRLRRIGIVALARKLLVALWRYLEHGEVPQGAIEVDWRTKVKVGIAAALA